MSDVSLSTMKGQQSGLSNFANLLGKEMKERQREYDFLNKRQMADLKKKDERIDKLIEDISLTHSYIRELQQSSKQLRDYILNPETSRYLKEKGRKIASDYGKARLKASNRDFGGLALNEILKHSKLGQILTGRYVDVPGSADRLHKERMDTLSKSAEMEMGNARAASFAEFGRGAGEGDKLLANIGGLENENIGRANYLRNAYDKSWKSQPRNERGQFASKSSSDESILKGAMKRGPADPTKAYVAQLPAAYSSGSILIYNKLDEMYGNKQTNKPKGGVGEAFKKLPIEAQLGALLSPAALANAIVNGLVAILGGMLTLAVSAIPLAIATTIVGKIFNIPGLDLTKTIPNALRSTGIPVLKNLFPDQNAPKANESPENRINPYISQSDKSLSNIDLSTSKDVGDKLIQSQNTGGNSNIPPVDMTKMQEISGKLLETMIKNNELTEAQLKELQKDKKLPSSAPAPTKGYPSKTQ
jgi:hypothetical protein